MKNRNANQWMSLTAENVNTLVGKMIKWQAPANSENENYSGIFQINKVLFSGTINGVVIDGDDLKCAYPDKDGYCYSDDDRFITYKVL